MQKDPLWREVGELGGHEADIAPRNRSASTQASSPSINPSVVLDLMRQVIQLCLALLKVRRRK